MTNQILQNKRRVSLALVMMLFAALGPLAATYPAEASFAVCRGDPILSLNNGLKVTFTVELDTSASNVLSVQYTVHAPAGVTLKQIKYPKDDLTGKESVVFVRDSPDTDFHVTTIALVASGPAATVLITGVNKKIVVTATGLTGRPIAVTLTALKQ